MVWLRRLIEDLRIRQNVDAHVVTVVVFAFAVVSIFGDVVPDQLKWAALLSGVGILVYRLTLPEERPEISTTSMLRSTRVKSCSTSFTGCKRPRPRTWLFVGTVKLESAGRAVPRSTVAPSCSA